MPVPKSVEECLVDGRCSVKIAPTHDVMVFHLSAPRMLEERKVTKEYAVFRPSCHTLIFPTQECVICHTVYVSETDWAGRANLVPWVDPATIVKAESLPPAPVVSPLPSKVRSKPTTDIQLKLICLFDLARRAFSPYRLLTGRSEQGLGSEPCSETNQSYSRTYSKHYSSHTEPLRGKR